MGLKNRGYDPLKNWAFDPNVLFPGADSIILKRPPIGYVKVQGDLNVKRPVWLTAPDPMEVPGCVICLERYLDGGPVIVRERTWDVFVGHKYQRYINWYYLRFDPTIYKFKRNTDLDWSILKEGLHVPSNNFTM